MHSRMFRKQYKILTKSFELFIKILSKRSFLFHFLQSLKHFYNCQWNNMFCNIPVLTLILTRFNIKILPSLLNLWLFNNNESNKWWMLYILFLNIVLLKYNKNSWLKIKAAQNTFIKYLNTSGNTLFRKSYYQIPTRVFNYKQEKYIQ